MIESVAQDILGSVVQSAVIVAGGGVIDAIYTDAIYTEGDAGTKMLTTEGGIILIKEGDD